MSSSKSTVLITGCSDGGLGAALAIAFHEAGLIVYATARNPSKMRDLASRGIKTLTLDVLSESSTADCVSKLSALDILVNNAGAGYNMPVSDISISEAKKLYDLNVWSYLEVTQAFLPLLLKSPKGMIVNQTSIGAVSTLPFQSIYTSSKAAISMISDTQRLEMKPLGIKVIDLKTGMVKSNLIKNHMETTQATLPTGSVYKRAKEVVEKALRQDQFAEGGMPASQWAIRVVADLLKEKPPPVIWRGESAWLARLGTILPHGTLDGVVMKMTFMDVVEQILRK